MIRMIDLDKNRKNTRCGSLHLRAMHCNHATCLGERAPHAGAIIALRRLHRQRTTSGHKPAFGINRFALQKGAHLGNIRLLRIPGYLRTQPSEVTFDANVPPMAKWFIFVNGLLVF